MIHIITMPALKSSKQNNLDKPRKYLFFKKKEERLKRIVNWALFSQTNASFCRHDFIYEWIGLVIIVVHHRESPTHASKTQISESK